MPEFALTDSPRVPDPGRACSERRARADLMNKLLSRVRWLEEGVEVVGLRTVVNTWQRKLGDDVNDLTYIFSELLAVIGCLRRDGGGGKDGDSLSAGVTTPLSHHGRGQSVPYRMRLTSRPLPKTNVD